MDTTFNAATPAAPRRQDWTARQREVLDLIADGRTNGEIAEALNISLGGAKWHVSEIMSKLGVESREAAAAYWTGERSARRRMRRAMHALGAPVFVKWMAAGGVTVAIGAGVAVAVLPLLADEPAPEVAAATVPRPAVFSNDQALAVARDLAQQLALGPFATYYMPPGERALGNPAGGFIMPAGSRRLDSNDLELVSAQFIRDTRSVESNVTGKTVALDAPADVWVVRFATRPPEQPDADHDADVLVAFRDGSGLPIVGGEIGADPVTHMPGGALVVTFKLAEFKDGPVTFALYGTSGADILWETDSRMPNASSGGGAARPDASRPLAASVSEHNGYAWAEGLVTDQVARIRLVTEDGREMFVEPGPNIEDPAFPWRGFIAAASGSSWFVTVEALDAAGNVIGSNDWSNHPTNPPLP